MPKLLLQDLLSFKQHRGLHDHEQDTGVAQARRRNDRSGGRHAGAGCRTCTGAEQALLGNDLGLSTLDFNTRRLGNFNPNAGVRTSVDDRDVSYGVFAGYRAERNFGVELGYNRFGKTKVTISDGISSASSSVKSDGVFVAGLYYLPLPANFELVGKLGVSNSKSTFNLFPFGQDNRSKVNPLYGVGVGYKLGDSLGLRAEFNRIPNFADNDRDLTNMKLGLTYGF